MIKGIDVSHFTNLTPQILNPIVKEQGLYFIFIKSSTGANGKDINFSKNWQIARSCGLLCGAYHWLWPLSDPAQQANNLVTQFNSVNNAGVVPPAVDIEWTWNAGDSQTPANELWNKVNPSERVPLIKEFLGKVEASLNVKPIIYTAFSFWNDLISKNCSAEDNAFFSSYPLWIADPNNKRKIPQPWADTTSTFTQTAFGENGTGADPYNHMDQDVFNGSLQELLNLCLPGLAYMNGFPYSQIVKDLQSVLIKKEVLLGIADGYFGTNTVKAITQFQTANGLTGNGVADAQTWNKLLV